MPPKESAARHADPEADVCSIGLDRERWTEVDTSNVICQAAATFELEGRVVPSARSGQETRQRILTATLDLISEVGLGGFTISDVAKKAAVNRALIYHYYKNRDDLITGAIDSLMTQFDTPESMLSGDAVARSARMYISHPEIGRLIFQLLLSGRPLERLGERFANTLKHVEILKQQQAPSSVGDATFGMVTLGLAQLSWSFSRDQLASILGMTVEEADDRFVEELRRVSEMGLEALFAQLK